MPEPLDALRQTQVSRDAPTLPPAADARPLSQIPETYDPATMGDVLSEEEFGQLPDWRKRRFAQVTGQREDEKAARLRAEGALSQMNAEMAALRAQVAGLQQNVSANKPEPEGWAKYSDSELEDFVSKGEETITELALDPTNEIAKANAAKLTGGKLTAVRQELQRRYAAQAVEGYRKEAGEKDAKKEQFQALLGLLTTDFGVEVHDPHSPLRQAAASEMEALKAKAAILGGQQAEAALIYQAFERAKTRLNGSRNRPSETDMARLGVEAAVRREAATPNQASALRARGDKASRAQASGLELDQALRNWFAG